MAQETTEHERISPGLMAAVFSFALALPAIGMFIGALIVGEVGLAFCGLIVFVIITSLYFAVADIVFWHSEETRIR
jgi:hypothetical protein